MLNRPFTGVIAAPLLPMHEGGEIDWATLERYIDWIAAQRPAGIVMNMDASEVIALEDDEQRRGDRGLQQGRLPHGCRFSPAWSADRRAPRRARRGAFAQAGAEGLAVFPPFPTFSGAPVPAEMIVRYHRAIAEASELPIICFQFPKGWGPDYTPEILQAMAEIPQLVAIKESSFDVGADPADHRRRPQPAGPDRRADRQRHLHLRSHADGLQRRPDRICGHRDGRAGGHARRRRSVLNSARRG